MSTEDGLSRGHLKQWDGEVADLLMFLVNDRNVKYRMPDGGHILLYPPDGKTRPFKAAAARRPNAQIEFLKRQFMLPQNITGPDGLVPFTEEEEPEVATTEAPEMDAAAAVRTLASALGVSLDNAVSEEDYLGVVAEKDACMARQADLVKQVEEFGYQVMALQSSLEEMTQQRDDLLLVRDRLQHSIDMAREALL